MQDLLSLHATHPRTHGKTPIRLNVGFRLDLSWWRTFVKAWNDVSFLPPSIPLPARKVNLDGSGIWGGEAWHGSVWFQVLWDQCSQSLTIAEKELLSTILAWTYGVEGGLGST